MKRFCTIVLVFLLPLQISWAIAGSYCAHEQSAALGHFGHHAHVHQAQADDDDSPSRLKYHWDCSGCHAVTFSVTAPGMKLLEDVPRAANLPLLTFSPPSPPVGEPERPKWASAV